jgi:uncharacterized membrane protein YhaH (DUF805 family)
MIIPSNWRLSRYAKSQGALTAFGFSTSYGRQAFWLIVPYWFLVLASGASAMMLRQRSVRQFNLSTLFIAMTLLAVVLAMISVLDRSWIGW